MSAEKRRRALIPRHGQQPLYVVAGLPIAVHGRVIAALQARFKHALFQGAPSPTSDGALYSAKLVSTLLRSVAQFTARRRSRTRIACLAAGAGCDRVPRKERSAEFRWQWHLGPCPWRAACIARYR
jgi:hypothetical protein